MCGFTGRIYPERTVSQHVLLRNKEGNFFCVFSAHIRVNKYIWKISQVNQFFLPYHSKLSVQMHLIEISHKASSSWHGTYCCSSVSVRGEVCSSWSKWEDSEVMLISPSFPALGAVLQRVELLRASSRASIQQRPEKIKIKNRGY